MVRKTKIKLSVSQGRPPTSRGTEFAYDAIGRLSGKERQLAGTGRSLCSYSYDVYGWLTSVTEGGFQERLYYADGLDGGCWNGNVSTVKWKFGSDSYKGYNLKYDGDNRLWSAVYGSTRELLPSEILNADSTDYLLGGSLTMRNGRIDKYQFDEGYCQATRYNNSQDNFTFYYYNRDHLGSIRQVTKADRITNGTVVQSMNYYPFGAQFCDGSTDSNVQPYKYNGKELDRMHGLNTYDYGARQYNPVTARWDRVDPLSEKYYNMNPYAYCGDNPVNAVDLDGKDWYSTENGTLIWNPNVHSQNDIGKKDADRGYKYVGETYYEKGTGTSYRKDGTVLYSKEELAYQRMWYLADVHWRSKKYPAGKEEMAYLLSDGKVLIMADNWNVSDKSYSKGYHRKKGVLYNQEGESFDYIGQVHTHQMGGDKGLSQSKYHIDDDNFAAADPDRPVFVMHKNGKIYAGVFSTKRKGFDNFCNQPIGIINNLFDGSISLIDCAKIIRSNY